MHIQSILSFMLKNIFLFFGFLMKKITFAYNTNLFAESICIDFDSA